MEEGGLYILKTFKTWVLICRFLHHIHYFNKIVVLSLVIVDTLRLFF